MTLNRLLPLAGAVLVATATWASAYTIPPAPFMLGANPANNTLLPPPPITIVRKHTVVRGDTFWKLAKAYYGKGARWKTIADANPGLEATGLVVGSVIIIP
jgi:5'-nucleotidase